MFENTRRGRQARNFTTNVLKIVDLKSSSEQIIFQKLTLGAPDVRESKPVLDSGFHAVDSGFQLLDSSLFSRTWILDSNR